MIIIEVFIKCKLLSVETVLSIYMRTHTCTHTQKHLHTQAYRPTDLKRAAKQRFETYEDSSTERETYGRSMVLGKKMFWGFSLYSLYSLSLSLSLSLSHTTLHTTCYTPGDFIKGCCVIDWCACSFCRFLKATVPAIPSSSRSWLHSCWECWSVSCLCFCRLKSGCVVDRSWHRCCVYVCVCVCVHVVYVLCVCTSVFSKCVATLLNYQVCQICKLYCSVIVTWSNIGQYCLQMVECYASFHLVIVCISSWIGNNCFQMQFQRGWIFRGC